MTTWSAARWRRFYASERERLGADALGAMLDRAPMLPRGAGVVFPHTRLEASGAMVAAAARAAIESGADEIVAIGVLHGGREADVELVRAARAGEPRALDALRGVHGPGAAGDAERWVEEFSLDAFATLLGHAARRAGRAAPRVHLRYPFLVGAAPETLPGLDELGALARRAFVVATTDPIHHGAGYDTAPSDRRDPRDPETLAWARATIEVQLAALAARDWACFAALAAAAKSDFRDVGPVLASVAPFTRAEILDLELVDYADVLGTARPTWVAAALAVVT